MHVYLLNCVLFIFIETVVFSSVLCPCSALFQPLLSLLTTLLLVVQEWTFELV